MASACCAAMQRAGSPVRPLPRTPCALIAPPCTLHADSCCRVGKDALARGLKHSHGRAAAASGLQILWGGTRDGRPVGGARYYLGDDFIRARGGRPALLTAVFVMGGGGVALEEIQYADMCELAWVYIPCRARNEKPYGSTYGPVHEWVRERLDKGPSQGRKYTCVPGPVAA
eukprot:364537-Chlamydomonas_euryale.AAC.2